MKTEISFTGKIGTNLGFVDETILQALLDMETEFNTDYPEFRLHLLKIGKVKHEKEMATINLMGLLNITVPKESRWFFDGMNKQFYDGQEPRKRQHENQRRIRK